MHYYANGQHYLFLLLSPNLMFRFSYPDLVLWLVYYLHPILWQAPKQTRRKYVHQYSLFNNDYPALSTYRHFSMRPIMYSSLVASNWYSSRIEIRKTKRTTNSVSIIVQHACVLIQKKINKYKIAKFTVRIRIFDKSIWYGDGLKMIERNIRTV